MVVIAWGNEKGFLKEETEEVSGGRPSGMRAGEFATAFICWRVEIKGVSRQSWIIGSS